MPPPRPVLGLLLLALPAACGEPAQPFEPPPEEGGWVVGAPGLYALARGGPETDIAALGYASGVEPAPEEHGERGERPVTLHDRERAWPGLNLYSSGHGPEAVLMDMDGRVLHTWHLERTAIPDAPPLDSPQQDTWRRVRLLDDGSLLAVYGGRGLVRVDRDSRLVWHFGERVHHDLQVLPDGRVLTLVREERPLPQLTTAGTVIDDFVVELSPAGEVLGRTSVMEALLSSRWADALTGLPEELRRGDVLHVNSIAVLEGRLADRHRAFAAGNWLLCARNLDLVFVLDPTASRVVWLLHGPWRGPHDPRELDGALLLFDNLGADGASRVVELDPLTGALGWEYRADPPQAFFSLFCGAAARLPNGNTLITESGGGRAFEVTRAGEPVWVFVSPHRAGPNRELVAALFEVERLPPEAGAWLER